MKRCYSCFKLYDENESVCTFCGKEEIKKAEEPIYLTPGTMLAERYIIGETIGSGGFGIIYKAWDLKLDTIVAIKEFFTSRLVTRAYGEKKVILSKKSTDEFNYRKDRFLAEARTMAQFGSHKNIPNVFEFFEENNTAYIVMELLVGQSLNGYLADHGGKLDIDLALMITNEVGAALKAMHEKKIIHRDVAPDNIFICSGKILKIKLLDLGAAQLADSTDDIIDIILKPGYSPYEQYDNSKNIGPWTDIYALGATLYVMLTGVKPEESTNRKQKDLVAAPDKINGTISENLSNAVMKAMTIDRHMRFKNTDDFLNAINGKKKIVSLAKERTRRRIKRVAGIVAACLCVSFLGIYVNDKYNEKKEVVELKKANITVWFSVKDNSTEEQAMQAVFDDFHEHYPDITINYEAIPEEEYENKIREAADKKDLPAIFESTGLSDEILEEARDVNQILASEQSKESIFLKQYKEYYNNNKKVPLGIVVPVAYIITNGYTYVEYEEQYFSKPEDFGENIDIAIDEDYRELIEKNFGTRNWAEESEFLDNVENNVAVLLSSSMVLDEIKQTIPNYQKNYICMDNEKIICEFTYEWSLGRGTEEQNNASDRLLSWMLGNVYQNTLMISRCSDGQLPVNEKCFNNKVKNSNLVALADVYKNFRFESED